MKTAKKIRHRSNSEPVIPAMPVLLQTIVLTATVATRIITMITTIIVTSRLQEVLQV
jgi:hypothetical protein